MFHKNSSGGVAQDEGPEFKPQCHKNNNNKKECWRTNFKSGKRELKENKT
jgi:hypothetical protein